MKEIRGIIGLLIIAVLLFPSAASFLLGRQFETPVHAQNGAKEKGPKPPREKDPRSKISADLQEKIDKGLEREASVVIQTEGLPSSDLVSAVGDLRGAVRKVYNKIAALSADLPAGGLQALAKRPDIEYISSDRPTEATGHLEITTGADLARGYGSPNTATINGSGIGIAILDTGIHNSHHSFLTSGGAGSRLIASTDFTGEDNPSDRDGHGTHVASIAAGNNRIANGAYTGIAPEANIISVKVLNSQGQGTTSAALQGIDWCIANRHTYNIRVMNLSFGTAAVDSYMDDPLCMAVRRAVDAGIVVCVAAGNLGKDETGRKLYGAVHSPGIEPSAITVGAANTKGTDSRSDDVVATYSSRGPTRGYYVGYDGHKNYDNLIKPDLVAPGNQLIAAQAPANRLVTNNPTLDANVSTNSYREMMRLSGTSAATPVVAGAAALLLQRNPNLTPNLVKAILEYTAQPLAGFNNYEQGAGLINVEGAVRLAGLVRQDVNYLRVGDPLLIGAAPTQASTIAGLTFNWGGGIIQSWNFITGTVLITEYQGIYGAQGVLLTDGVLLSGGVLSADGVLLTDGVLLSEGVLISDGTLLSEGTLLTEGVLLVDGTLLIDGTLLSDGVILSGSALAGTAAAVNALRAIFGDSTGGAMSVIEDIE